MDEVTDEWIREINEEFSGNDIPHEQRPWLAYTEWGKQTTGWKRFFADDPNAKKIFDWFKKNTKPALTPSMFTGSFYFDACIWPITIPIVFGNIEFYTLNSLKTMPDPIKTRLKSQKDKIREFINLWSECYDFAYGIDPLIERENPRPFAHNLLKSGQEQLNETVALLNKETANSSAAESARMATEMFLKAFLAYKAGLTEREAKKIGHNLEIGLDKCLEIDPCSELRSVRSELTCFPSIHDRYKGLEKSPRELWRAYRVAQFTGAAIVRSLSGRDSRCVRE